MLRLLTWKSMLTWPLVGEGEVVCPNCFHCQSDTYRLFDELRRFLCHKRLFGHHLKEYANMLCIVQMCEYGC
jgi:hypothetical protein